MKVCLAGSSGKMGVAVEKCLSPEEIVGRIHRGVNIEEQISGADIIIDFSSPELLQKLLTISAIPIVSGTTGVCLKPVSSIPFLHAPNFSVGIILLEKMLKEVAHLEAVITETHRTEKKDKPSGTALHLQQIFHQMPRVISHRLKEAIAEHSVEIPLADETLILTHRAHDRSVFARGAIRAARWLCTKPPGMYNLQDIL